MLVWLNNHLCLRSVATLIHQGFIQSRDQQRLRGVAPPGERDVCSYCCLRAFAWFQFVLQNNLEGQPQLYKFIYKYIYSLWLTLSLALWHTFSVSPPVALPHSLPRQQKGGLRQKKNWSWTRMGGRWSRASYPGRKERSQPLMYFLTHIQAVMVINTQAPLRRHPEPVETTFCLPLFPPPHTDAIRTFLKAGLTLSCIALPAVAQQR